MNGLQAIRERIMEEARNTATQISEQADQQVTDILSAAETDKAQLLADATQKGKAQAESLLARARSTVAMENRKSSLRSRQDMIDRAIGQATEQVRRLPDESKVDYYRSLISSSSIKDGDIVLSAEDRHMADKLLEGNSGLSLSEEIGEFNGGLVIRRGLVEDNLTLAILVTNIRPELVRLAADTLFPDSGMK